MSEPPGIVLQTIQWICLGIWRQSFFSMFTFTDTDSTLYIWYSSLKLNTIDIVCKILKYVHLYKSFKFFCMYKILQTHVADMLNKYKYCILVPLSLSSTVCQKNFVLVFAVKYISMIKLKTPLICYSSCQFI